MTTHRPLSPHLQIYRPQLTSVLSILHRGSGVLLALGTGLLVYWLLALASGPDAYAAARECLGAWYVQVALAGWAAAFYYHLCNGIRHLFWDAGKGLDLASAYRSGYAVLAGTAVLTAITLYLGMRVGVGAP